MGDTGGRGKRHHRWPGTLGLSLLIVVLLLPGLSLADPSVEATLSDTPSMTPVGPGETIEYDVLISNSGDMPATDVTLTDQSGGNNTSFTAGSLRTTPLCQDDSFSTPANTPLDTSPASVLDNDTDPDGTGPVCIISGGSCIAAPLGLTSAQGGTVTLNVTGTFSYTPPPGFNGTDTFAYPINDVDGNDCLDDLGAPTTATVTIDVLGPSTGTILIVKDTLPDAAQDFAFTSPGLSPSSFSLDDDSDGTLANAQMFSTVVPGSYTVTETAVAGFLPSVSCTDPDSGTTTTSNSATIDLDAGETVTCTFTNTQQGTLNIIKDSVPNTAQDFAFSTTGGLSPASFSLDDDADATLSTTQTFPNVNPGSYTVTETAVPGFDTTISCVDPDNGTTTAGSTATIDFDAGETITCTFTNTQRGTIVIVKDALPDSGQDFSFTDDVAAPNSFVLDDDGGLDATLSNTETFSDIVPGSYSVTEEVVAGFLQSVSCSDPDNGTTTAGTTATIDLDAGETITCTFTNTQQGTLNIMKDTVPDSGQDFAFTTTGGLVPLSFTLDDDADGTLSNAQTFMNVNPGSYSVTEAAVAGFDTSVNCSDPDNGTLIAGSTATIDFDPGETITCTYTNTQQGTIEIVKDTVPDSGQDFAFTAMGGLSPASFSLDDDSDGTLVNTQTFPNVSAGSYTITETPVPGFTTTLSCNDPDSGTTIAGPMATIDLDPGETVTCTYTNTQQGSITIIKDTVPDSGQDFSFTDDIAAPNMFLLDDDGGADATLLTTQTFNNVDVGTYTVTEAAVAGFDTTVSCVDPDNGSTTSGTNIATIDLDAGEDITCTFTNTQRGTIQIIKDTVPNDAQDFAFTDDIAAPNSFNLDDDADMTLSNTQTFNNVVPGSYTVTETTPPTTFFLSNLSCSDPSGGTTIAGATATIALAAGETVTCTYENTATVAPSATADPTGGLPMDSTPSNDATVAGTDHAYHTALNTLLTVPDGANDLLANDTLGTPTATLSSFGPTAGTVTMFAPDSGTQPNATAQGGSLAVSADGSFVYTPPSATFTGLDSFVYRLTNLAGTSDAMVTLGVGLRPSAVNDTVTTGATGNIAMQSDRLNVQLNGLPSQTLISNDGGDQISVTAISATSTNNGNASSVAGNHFRYNPPPGFEGMDTFTYTIDNGFSQPSMGTVSITVSDMLWFIDNNAGAAGDGRLSSPFQELAGAGNSFASNAADEAGDNIFVDRNVAAAYTGGVTLLDNQRLIGDGSSSDLATLTGITPAPGSDPLPTFGGTDPLITTTNATAITLAQGNTIRGLTIGNTGTGTGILGNTVGTLSISETSIMGTGQAVDLATGTLNVTFESITVTSSSAGGIALDTVSGSFSVNDGNAGTIQDLDIDATSGGAGIAIANSSATFTFSSLEIDNTSAEGIQLTNNTGSFTVSSGTIGSTNDPTGDGVDISGGSANVSIAATVTKTTAGEVADVQSRTGGTVTFSGNLTCNTGCTGINVANNTGGTTTFSAGTKTVNTGTNTAVNLATNTGHTINFTGGGLDIDTTTGTGFGATGGGTVTVQGANNSVNTTRTAVNITDTTIGVDDVTFQRIDVNGGGSAVAGIILANTGSGTFNVTGTGADGTGGTIENILADAITLNNTDGRVTLEDMIIEDIGDTTTASPGHHGVDGQQVDGGLTLINATIQRVTDSAIHGEAPGGGSTTWNGLTLTDSILAFSNRFHIADEADGGATDEAMVTIEGISGTVSITDNDFDDGPGFVNLFTANSGTVDITIQSNTFDDGRKDLDNMASVGSSGVRVRTTGTIDAAIRIGDPMEADPELGNTFTDAGSDAAIFIGGFSANDSASVDLVISQNTSTVLDHTSPLGLCTDINTCAFDFPNGGIGVESRGSGSFEAIISQNTLVETQNSGSLSTGSLRVDVSGTNTEVIVRNNTLTRSWDGPLFIRADDADGNGAQGFLLIQDNVYQSGTIGEPGSGDDLDVHMLADSPAPFLPNRFQVRNGATLDLTVINDDMVLHDIVSNPEFDSLDMRINGDAVGGTSSTFNVLIQDTVGPEGFRFRNDDADDADNTDSEFNLSLGDSTDPTATDINDVQAESVLDDNNNTTTGGGAPDADVPFTPSGVNIVTTTPTQPSVFDSP